MKYRKKVLILLFFLSIITYLDRVCISVAGPAMQSELTIAPDMWGWVVGVFAISYAAFEIPSGALGDRIGPRRVLTRIVTWWSIFTVLTGMARSVWFLLPIRFLFGAGEAGAYPNASSSISKWFPVAERASAHGVVWMASRVGGALSPLLVVPIQAAFGWRMSFYVFGVIGIFWAVIWYRWYRDRPSQMEGVTQAEIEEIGDDPHAVHRGLPWRQVARSSNLWALMAMYFTYCYAAYFYLSWFHTYLAKGRGFSEKDQLLSMLPFVLGAISNLAGGWVSDRLVKRFGLKAGRRLVGMTGLGMAAVFTAATVATGNKYLALLFLSLGFAGSDFMLPVAWAVCLDIGRRHAGAVTGTMNTAGQIGSFLSSVIFGYIVKYTGDYNTPLIPMTAMLVVSTLLWLKIDPSRPLVPEEGVKLRREAA
ncbi:MAG: MFS transporter [Bryobacterales bacterium]|nr:MFS transporter [Bryobacterales bacterium]